MSAVSLCRQKYWGINVINVVKATLDGLKKLKDADNIARLRGKTVDDVLGKRIAEIFRKSKQDRTLVAVDTLKTGAILHPVSNLTIQFAAEEEEEAGEEALSILPPEQDVVEPVKESEQKNEESKASGEEKNLEDKTT